MKLGLVGTRLAASVLGVFFALGQAQAQATRVSRGAEIVRKNCAICHAVGRNDASNHPDAPAFRTLSERYPIEHLSEALAEGLSTGHPDMPDFVFKVDEVQSMLAYLQSIQERERRGTQ